MARNPNIAIYFHVHLVSDSTGETLVAMMKASTAQFGKATALEHLHSLVRSEEQMRRTLEDIENRPGVVLYTLVNPERRRVLEEHCANLNIPVISILDTTLAMLGRYLGAPAMQEIRTSKTPTSIYLANRGYRTGNIPLVPTAPWPKIIETFEKPFIVGLFASPSRIVQIRQQRLENLNAGETDYTDEERVREEMRQAKRMFIKMGYPVVDVTRRSIEETSAQIINLYQARRDKQGQPS